MKYITEYAASLLLLLPLQLLAQETPVLPLDTILQRIERNNVLLQSFALKAESYKYTADAATAWMPPMVGVGTFMTPYPGQEIMDTRDKGNLMLQIEQDIPNPAKLAAKKRFIASQGNVDRATRDITLNDLKSQARRLYSNWLIAGKRISVLEENEKLLVMMKKIEEVRYPYNQSPLGNVYKANAGIEENRNMIRMQQGEIAKARAWLNSLMNAAGNDSFDIDTTYQPLFNPMTTYDTLALSGIRKDVFRMDESIRSMTLNIESMKMQKKPDFRIRYDNMYPLGSGMPTAFSIMGMATIPIAPWASRMYKSEIKSMQLNIESMQKERSAMLQETQGMLYGMQYEIQTMQTRVKATEDKVITALKQALDANFITYQENRMQLTQVIDSWEALTMMQMTVLDDKLKLYEMIIEYEKALYR
ncbi:TolC family protein [Flavihumibacter petaseus]|nr:TolC family protein [Flavihumibacter petaseus]